MANAQVDDGSINTLAGLFGGWSTDVGRMMTSLGTIKIEAGNFEAATELKAHVEKRSDELNKSLGNLQKTLDGIKVDLQAVATTYSQTTDDNTVTVSVLDQLTKDVSNNLPGFRNYSK